MNHDEELEEVIDKMNHILDRKPLRGDVRLLLTAIKKRLIEIEEDIHEHAYDGYY